MNLAVAHNDIWRQMCGPFIDWIGVQVVRLSVRENNDYSSGCCQTRCATTYERNKHVHRASSTYGKLYNRIISGQRTSINIRRTMLCLITAILIILVLNIFFRRTCDFSLLAEPFTVFINLLRLESFSPLVHIGRSHGDIHTENSHNTKFRPKNEANTSSEKVNGRKK